MRHPTVRYSAESSTMPVYIDQDHYCLHYSPYNSFNSNLKINEQGRFTMPNNQADDSRHQSVAFLTLAFRPLFLLGTLFSVLAIAWWTHYWTAPSEWMPYGGVIWWHGHEMLFGFAMAIVTGFLLTAVKTWTGVATINGFPLALLVIVWLTARILIAFGANLSPWLVALVDVSYLLFCSIAMAYPVLKAKQWRNLMFVPILLLFATLNSISHWSIYANRFDIATHSLHATILLLTLVIAILGGRVIPAFTANATGIKKAPVWLWLEASAILSILLMVVIAFIGFDKVNAQFLLVISAFASLVNGLRFLRWGFQNTFSNSLLWSLHFSFMFIPAGFLLVAFYAIEILQPSLNWVSNISAALHSFTIGAIGGMILAMISRVTLGHTGRRLKARRLVTISFHLILLSAIIRIIFPLWMPQFYSVAITATGVFWLVAFGIFLVIYSPMLVSRRADGRLV